MERFVKGDVVVVAFPFSDLTATKKRPAVVLASLEGDDVILCQVTSSRQDNYSLPLAPSDFSAGKLPVASHVRPNKLFTADASIIRYKAGALKRSTSEKVIRKVCSILTS